jgi:hypothetical protein
LQSQRFLSASADNIRRDDKFFDVDNDLDDLPVGQGCSEISLFDDFGMVSLPEASFF